MRKTHSVHSGSAVLASLEEEAAEQSRWLLWFGTPALIAAIFVGVSFATGQMMYLIGTVLAIIADIGVLIYLALTSDTNRAPAR